VQLAPVFPLLYKVLKPAFPKCLWSGRSDNQAIALTFDDGPHAVHTPPLLEVLDYYQVQASFFWLGICVQRFPQTALKIWQQGYWIGLHGYDHRSFPQLSTPALQQTLVTTQQAIAQSCQIDLAEVQHRIRDVRPPNGLFTPRTLSDLERWNYRPVMWSVVPEDWVRPGVEVAVARILKQVQNGSIIVLHDGYNGGEDVAAIAAQLIPILLQQGYQFVTINELWQQHSPPKPTGTP
jgi:peptidoglycan/xylan/chitin deacetylase (PgdA/CDA1 family)